MERTLTSIGGEGMPGSRNSMSKGLATTRKCCAQGLECPWHIELRKGLNQILTGLELSHQPRACPGALQAGKHF